MIDKYGWIDINDELPETRGEWSKQDVLIACLYNYEIGRTKAGKWIDMNNKPLDNVTHWQPLLVPETHEQAYQDSLKVKNENGTSTEIVLLAD